MAATVYIVLALCALANGAFLRRPHLDGRIIGGEDAEIKDYPYQVSLMVHGTHSCGASIISATWVLTAAHCISNTPVLYLAVRAGSSIKDSGGSVHQVAKIITHEQYNTTMFDYDFGLVEVETPFSFGQGVQSVGLAANEPAAGENSVISGWGALKPDSDSPQLQVVNVPIVDRKKCIKKFAQLTDSMICAGVDEGGKDACRGDYGGPLVVGGELAGVASWSTGCGYPKYPGVYSNVANQRQWIKDNSGI